MPQPAARSMRPRAEIWPSLCAWLCILLCGAVGTSPAQPAKGASASTLQLSIVEPADGQEVGSSPILLKLAVQVPPGETLLGLRALVDGRLAAQSRGLKLVSDTGSDSATASEGQTRTYLLSVPIPPADATLAVQAEGTRAKSALVLARLRWRGPLEHGQAAALPPKLYVLSIGVSDYSRADLRLRFAAKDASDVAALLLAQRRGLYRDVESRVLVNQRATKGNILDGLEWIQRQTTSKDVAIVFLAGHGIVEPSTGSYYFLPHDADPGAVKRTMVPDSDIRSTLANIAGKTLFFIDTCHSGRVFDGAQSRDASDLTAFVNELAAADNGVVVFAASTGRQASQEAPEWNNGAFTRALLEGLRGRADHRRSGRITLTMLDYYVSERVKELTAGRQTPTTAKPSTIADFPVALIPEVTDDDVAIFR